MRYEIVHQTAYRYEHDVSVSHHVARLAPRTLARQHCRSCELIITPTPALARSYEDYFGNRTEFFTVEGAHRELVVTMRSVLDSAAPELPAPGATPPWETLRDQCRGAVTEAAARAGEFVFRSPLVPCAAGYADYAAGAFGAGRPVLEAVRELTRRIFGDFKFDPRATTVATPLERVFRERRGVCQDFAHLQIACLRSLGLPARYVSGYLETLPPPGQPKLVGADASHAWVQVFCGDAGWIDVDPTNDLLAGERHLTVAWGRDFSDVSPIRGVIIGGGKHELRVAVDVLPQVPAGAAPA
jgi:transglutaminase-like putative cysteine protease